MRDFFLWMFVNVMVAVGLGFVSSYPPSFLDDRSKPSRYPWRYLMSAGTMAVFCMIFPWQVSPGVQFDLRSIPLGLAGWLHGLPVSVVIGLAVTAVRLWIGGAGAGPAILVVIYCVAVSQAFRRRPQTPLWLALMGLTHGAGFYLIIQLTLRPRPAELGPTSPYWLVIAAVYAISPWLLHMASHYAQVKRELEIEYAAELRTKEALLELIPYGILFLDGERRVMSTNRAARSLLEQEQLPTEVLRHPELAKALRERRRISHCRISFPSRRYGECIVLVSSVPLPGGGAVLGMENVTPVVRQEREEAMRDRLETLGRLAAIAAHEIKNPLTTIKGFMQLMAAKPEFAGHRSTFSLVQGETDHINRVVSDFLELSGRSQAKPTWFGLDELLTEVLRAMELHFPESGVQAELIGDEAILLEANRKSVKQILKNLVANAYEAMPAGGRLTIRRVREGNRVALTVTDTGTGIAPDVLPLIFTPYMTTKATGTGLGLVISHKLAVEMGGQLEVSSQQGEGCSFSLTLPVCVAALEAAAGVMGEGG